MAMKPRRNTRPTAQGSTIVLEESSVPMIFSSDLLTPEEERELLGSFWDCKTDLVKHLIRNFPRLRQHKPPPEPWPMAQFIRDHCDDETREILIVRRLHDRYVHYKHRLASANIRLAARSEERRVGK